MTDLEVRTALDDYHALALTIFGEARGEPIEGKVFVGSVIRNRVKRPKRYGDTYARVCLARAQFSCWWQAGGKANFDLVMAKARLVVDADHVDRASTPSDAALEECRWVASGILSGALGDRALGATHYITRALWRSAPPEWAKGQTPSVEVGSHVGFRL